MATVRTSKAAPAATDPSTLADTSTEAVADPTSSEIPVLRDTVLGSVPDDLADLVATFNATVYPSFVRIDQ